MLESFYIDGFKGLRNFKLDLKPNLNVLVGSNGSGKTSILGGLEFVSHIAQGEVGQIPNKFGVKKPDELFHTDAIDKQIHLIIQGTNMTDCRNILSKEIQNGPGLGEVSMNSMTHGMLGENQVENQSDRFVTLNSKYRYECKIKHDNQGQLPLYIDFQSLRMDFNFVVNEEDFQDYFEIAFEHGKLITDKNDLDAIGKYITPDAMLIIDDFGRRPDKFTKVSFLENLTTYLYPVNNIISDLSFGKAYDIYPSSVKQGNNQHPKLVVEFDGAGLTDILMKLKTANSEKYEEVLYYMKKLSSDIVDIDVVYNDFEKRNEIFMKLLSSNASDKITKLSMNSISDGALKWFSLLVAVLLMDSPIVIDEPENFLSPEMQERLILLIREELEINGQLGILTTHSESVVNTLKPDEIILVHVHNRLTCADRVIQPDKLQEHMNLTGFGLGWIYQTGTLDDYCY